MGGRFDRKPTDAIGNLVALNTTAVLRLASTVTLRFVMAGSGAIINIGSVVGLVPEFGQTVYGATKSFVLFLSQGLDFELGPKGIDVQAVLPSATGTEIWERAGADTSGLPVTMGVGELVDAALAGFDLHEAVTIPPLHNGALWGAYQQARQGMLPEFGNHVAAPRYQQVA